MVAKKNSSQPGWCVYILRCSDDTLYTGVSNDIDGRVATHNAGKGARYTRSRLPVELVYVEEAVDRGSAQSREAAIKRLTTAEKRLLVGKEQITGGMPGS